MCFSLSPPYLSLRACITCECVCRVSLRLAPSRSHAITRRSVGATSTHFLCNRFVTGGRCRFSIVRSSLITALAGMREREPSEWLASWPIDFCGIVYCVAEPRLSLFHISALTRNSRGSRGSRFPSRGRGIDSSRYLVRAYSVHRSDFSDLDRSSSR